MSKQTAVEWLIQRLHNRRNGIFDGHPVMSEQQLYEQAKAMEREQIEKAYDAGHDDGHDEANGDGSYYDTKEEYYERTYGKEAIHEG